MFCKEERIKQKVIEEFLVMFFGFLITNLPCYVVNFLSAVRISYCYPIEQVVGIVQEVIRLDVIL